MAIYSTNEFKGGLKIMLDNDPSSIIENEIVKPGKGQAFNRVKKSGEAHRRAHRQQPDEHGHAASPPSRACRFAGFTRRPTCPRTGATTRPRLSRTAALHARHSRHGLSRQALDHAPVLRLCLARRNQPALPVPVRARRKGLSVAFDLPTLMGYDSDHPISEGEVANAASPSIRSRTWRSSSTASIWRRPRSR